MPELNIDSGGFQRHSAPARPPPPRSDREGQQT
jgi:hypothetical protein